MAKNLGKFVFVLMAMTAAPVWAAGPDDDFINSRSFSIPIGITGGQKDKLDEIELYVSSDEGKTWIMTSVIPPNREGFTYTAPTDGTYWFKVCTVDKKGAREPNDINKAGVTKKILVDTLPPTVRIAKAERQGENITVSWEIQEMNPDLNALKVEYKTADGYWHPITVIPAMIGQGQFRPLNNGPLTVRMKVSDLAGNQAVDHAEVAGRPEEAAPGLTTTSMQLPSGGQNASTAPIPSFPPPSQPAQSVPNPVYTAANFASSVPPVNPSMSNPAPAMPGNTVGVVPPMPNANSGGQGGEFKGSHVGGYTSPRMTINSNLPPAPQSLAMQPNNNGNAVQANWQQNNVQPAGSNVLQAEVRNYGDRTWSPPASAASTVGGLGLPPSNPPGYVATRWINNVQTTVTNNSTITLDYRVDRVGPSGVGAVDLYLTEDDGRTWQRYAEDADLFPPMVVNLPGEGTFGLRLVVTSKAGLGRRPPQPGDAPDMRVEVDTTAPVVKLYRPEPDSRRRDAIVLTWQASDNRNLATSPITLQWAERPDGAWQTIATDLANSGRYVWTVQPNLVHVYLRVVARDMAGNQGFDETADPILVDLNEPEAKILGISSGVRKQ